MPKNSTTWGASWNSGATKVVRVPVALENQIMAYARAVDNNEYADISQREGDIFLILEVIERYIEYKRGKHHPNQHSRELDINTRAWDELRKFQKLLQENPGALGLPGAD
jgi:hypothetical protein